VQLLEARNLERSYWSALAIGPMKHLGLSKAHGKISSFCSLELRVQSELDDSKNAFKSEKYNSPVIHNQNSPVWPDCEWDIPLEKRFPDGMPIILDVEAREDSSAAESMGIPLVPSEDDRLLGRGDINVTCLCLGVEKDQTHAGIIDEWIKISKNNKETGEVRILISYTPYGLDPQQDDIVALEAFARRSLTRSSCTPLVHPLQPLKVLQKAGGFLLVEYHMRNRKRATLRLNRKAVFVVERFNFIDGAISLAALPVDAILSTPAGQYAQNVSMPIIHMAGELIMPVALSTKLLWVAFRTTGSAAFSGVMAATGSVLDNSREAGEQRRQQMSFRRANISSI